MGAHPAASSQGASGKGSLVPGKRAEFPFREPSSSFLVGIPEAVLKTEKVEQKHKHLKGHPLKTV